MIVPRDSFNYFKNTTLDTSKFFQPTSKIKQNMFPKLFQATSKTRRQASTRFFQSMCTSKTNKRDPLYSFELLTL